MRELRFWWWGEDETPGLGRWLEDARDAFRHESGIDVDLHLLQHDQVLTAFPDAARRGHAPDLQFFWNGIYHVEFVWQHMVAPLDDLLNSEELQAFGGGPQSRVGGKTYRAAWYVIPVCWLVNEDVLARAGLTRHPPDWESFLEACARVRAAGLEPLTVGDAEGDFSVWWLAHFLTQAFDEPGDVARLVLGELDWSERPYCDHWRLLAEVANAGFLDESALPLTLWKGLERFNEGRSAFTLASGPMLAGSRRALGDAVRVFVAPRAAPGKLSGLPIVDTQGIGIAAGTREPVAASDFLRALNDPIRLEKLWDGVQLLPANRRWSGPPPDAAPDYQLMWRWFAEGPNAPYVPNLIPLELHFELAAALGRAVLASRIDPDDAAAAARERCADWARRNPSGVARYRTWILEDATVREQVHHNSPRHAHPSWREGQGPPSKP